MFAEANFELRQPDPNADPDSLEGQRQIFLRHGTPSRTREFYYAHMITESIRVLRVPRGEAEENVSE